MELCVCANGRQHFYSHFSFGTGISYRPACACATPDRAAARAEARVRRAPAPRASRESKLQKPYIDFTLTQTNTGFTIYTHAACWGPTHTLTHFKNTAVALRVFSHLSSGTDLARCGARTAPTLDGAAGGACVLPEPPPHYQQCRHPTEAPVLPTAPRSLVIPPRWRRRCCRGPPCPRSPGQG